ncbi:DNA processing protein [Dehalogenimonas formicexedens]|uniref:DNA processing protein n=1 Tax=Dehalogenimonas formicexedens TaxID=1839801 RepID=A0A1P8F6L6_9CHLR|nr:DNA-processing protein DprA [Dehalogenimonas formicexedens]APV44119.1 DNA processing protein [Dehalogenimonas formicexedens]
MSELSLTACHVGFSLIPGIGRVRLSLLENHFGDLATAWRAEVPELAMSGIDSGTLKAIAYWRPRIDPERELEKAANSGVQVLTVADKGYPSRLKEIYDYPPVLYVKGGILPEDELSVAVVGTRKPTVYGRQVTEELVTELTRNRITIASGLARGIDTIAHQTAIKNGGRTIAVMGSGVNIIYPSENAALAKQILENGALISECAIDAGPRPENFPRRNRILSGLTLGTLVTEAGEGSGALITADYALEQDREVFAVPGSILSPQSSGTNRLIQQGAKLVRRAGDVLEELNVRAVAGQLEFKEVLPENDTEQQLIKYLGVEPVHIDEICRSSGMPTPLVSSTLAMMELKGMVKQTGGMNYCRTRQIKENLS